MTMTKHYCDLCGADALTSCHVLSHVRELKSQSFSATKCTGASAIDGSWFPAYRVSVDFKVENQSKQNMYSHTPDLCGQCMIGLLTDLSLKIQSAIGTEELRVKKRGID